MRAMEQFFVKKGVYLLDVCSVYMLKIGLFNGQDIALFLGALGSVFAIINHGSQWWTKTGRNWWYGLRRKKTKKNKL